MLSQKYANQLEQYLLQVDTSTVQMSGFPRMGRRLVEPYQVSEDRFDLKVDPVFYGQDIDMRNYFITPERAARHLTQTVKERDVRVYWGTEVSHSKPHIGHLLALELCANMVQVYGDRIKVNILLADKHTKKSKRLSQIDIDANLESMRGHFKRIFPSAEIVVGSEFEDTMEYVNDVREFKQWITIPHALKALPALTRKKHGKDISEYKDITVAMLDYIGDQIVDQKYVGGHYENGIFKPGPVDISVAGLDQRHIYALGDEKAQRIGLVKPAIMFTPLISSLSGTREKMSKPNGKVEKDNDNDMVWQKMSKSDGKVDDRGVIWVDDPPEKIHQKIKLAYLPRDIGGHNAVIDAYRFLVFPFKPFSDGIYMQKPNDEIDFFTPERFLSEYTTLDPHDVKETLSLCLSSVLGSMLGK